MRERVVDRVNNCKEFLSDFFNALSKYGKMFSSDIGSIFDRIGLANFIVSSKYIEKHGSSESTRGMAIITKGKRLVYSVELSGEIQGAYNNYAAVALAEILHHAKEKGKYSDEQLDDAALSLLSAEERKRVKSELKDQPFGTIGHRSVSAKCIPTNPNGLPPK